MFNAKFSVWAWTPIRDFSSYCAMLPKWHKYTVQMHKKNCLWGSMDKNHILCNLSLLDNQAYIEHLFKLQHLQSSSIQGVANGFLDQRRPQQSPAIIMTQARALNSAKREIENVIIGFMLCRFPFFYIPQKPMRQKSSVCSWFVDFNLIVIHFDSFFSSGYKLILSAGRIS